MTELSLKLFNKLPFKRNEIGGLSRPGRASGWRLVERAKNPKRKGMAGGRSGRRTRAAKWCFVTGVCYGYFK